MRIREIRAAGLRGRTPEGGWTEELKPEACVHTLVAVHPDEGVTGLGIARWDILGKATGQPVGRLLGGRYRDKVRPYASILMDEPAAMSRKLDGRRAQGV